MKVPELTGVNLLNFDAHEDHRGKWQRCWDRDLIAGLGQDSGVEQISVSINPLPLTLRGLHSLDVKARETKSIFCISGRVQDVVLDVRPDSPTYLDHLSIELHPGMGLILEPGLAHGFLTLEENSNLAYVMSTAYKGELEQGFLWSDPKFDIEWFALPRHLSKKDSCWSRLNG